jgi:hypothetical protein
MLVVKAGSGLTVGTGAQIDQIRVRAQPASDSPTGAFFFDKYVPLCTVEGPTCRPTKFATEDYEGSLTLPIHFLLQPGDQGLNDDIRVWVDGLSNNTVVLASGLRFHFSKGHRLWLELPLFPQCLGMVTCQEEDLACGSDTDCVSYVPTRVDSSDDAGQSPTADLSGDDLSSNADFAQAPIDLAPVFADLSAPCGVDGLPCCTTGTPCTGTNAYCDSTSTCATLGAKCGDKNMTCCADDGGGFSCNSASLVCEPAGSTCQTCGASGQACCTSNACNSGARCNQNTTLCEACGGIGLPCCTGNLQCNDSSLTCTDGTCATACGNANQPCCATDMCNGTLRCNTNTNRCGNCGPPTDHTQGSCPV